ncbi:MAG: ScpA family protein [Rhodospirillaceae bacterium]
MADNEEIKAPEFEEDERTAVPKGQEWVVDVGGFEGPIDVLLTLARNQKVDLAQISMLQLADQYLEWVAIVRRTNLELAADYLVMAAWLAYLKSRLLLPNLSKEEEPSGEEMAAALQFQLQRLESMQDAGVRLMARDRLGQDFFKRGEPEKFGYTAIPTIDVSLYDLLSAYSDHTHRSNVRTLHIQASDLYSPDDAVQWLKKIVGRIPEWSDLSQFLPGELTGDIVSRSMMASALVAALTMTKEGRIQLRQGEQFGPLYIRDIPPPNDNNPPARPGGAETGTTSNQP